MYIIEKSREIADKIFEIWVNAPHVARNAKAGQFVIIRTDEAGERIPLTISRASGDLVRIIFMAVGKTTYALAAIKQGDAISDIVGPLGHPSEVKDWGTCVIVGGGAGIASTPCIAQALRAAGNTVVGIIGARNAGMLILEDEMREVCDELFVATDDGSRGHHGFAADILKQLIAEREIDAVWIIGPTIMMKVTSMATREKAIKTFVSLNPIMVDGTGMCGSCRCQVEGKTVFACVDGPEFDAHQVNFDLLMQRQRYYMDQEKEALARWNTQSCSCRGGT
ncbi:MAG TPA: sulfide/dihydroorotate dehydrogenase-like FAD/NAD-binding protein [Methanospirillum sp.]|nr:sulfide/dihydroorotate dehydrogenase-like FAD/NAD-binding protein [Methanospirillum sp.]